MRNGGHTPCPIFSYFQKMGDALKKKAILEVNVAQSPLQKHD